MGELDSKHVTVHMSSLADTKRALAHPENKIKASLFSLFRWISEFEIGKDNCFTAVSVRMHNLPLHYFNEASIHHLGSVLGTVLRIHPSTVNLTQQQYAKICTEMYVSKPLLDKLLIGTSKEYGWSISLEYEGNHAYCVYHGLRGHSIGLCHKKRQDQGKEAIDGNTRHNKPTYISEVRNGLIMERGYYTATFRE